MMGWKKTLERCLVSSGVLITVCAMAAADHRFEVKFDAGAVVSLKCAGDTIDTEYIASGRKLGDVFVRYRQPNGDWQVPDNTSAGPLVLESRFEAQENTLLWTLTAKNVGSEPLEVGDLAVPLPIGGRSGRQGPVVLKHGLICGHGSFLFWMRSNSVGPYLTLTPVGNTSLEYWDTQSRQYRVYIHSVVAGAEAKERGCNWRQPHTSLTLAPGDSRSYAFKLRWADDYDAVRQILVDEGQIDVHVVPGMTVPTDLFARFALRTKEPIRAIEAEFPETTRIDAAGENGDYRLYQVRFEKLGENRLTVRYGDGRRMFLEFFCTEPLETLIKKRAAFIAGCQHRDSEKWYNGLISEWNMETQVLLGPDNYDRIRGWRIYEVTCDDPGLCKPAFLAAKNAEFPAPREVEAMDYYIEHFVWDGLQRTTEETYSYGIYGIPDWKQNRDSNEPGRNGRLHLWRCYDYPHVVVMYWGMYRVARDYPHIETSLTAKEYLQRAYGTALAMFTVPMEIEKWSAYGTGFYNELVIVDLIAELEATGMRTEADKLRSHWERKVRVFVNDKPDLFRSEYAFDSTGFESTHALAKYAMQHAGQAGLAVSRADAERFMETQMAANLFCRGWLEPAYYLLGSDFRGSGGNSYTLTYMSQMGGWGVLDYALNVAKDPAPYLRLGYASYLSAWALMNTGTPESDYGYWYPGKANDGAAGGGFEPAPYGTTWLGQPHHRGSWYYACEIDLGYCGALRTAATILADDPIFGRFCFGGDWSETSEGIRIVPRDGLRRRFSALLRNSKLHVQLERDRFCASWPIVLQNDLTQLQFRIETDNPAPHTTRLHLSGLPLGTYMLQNERGPISEFEATDNQKVAVDLPVEPSADGSRFTLSKSKGMR
jgi:hypothetical protein